MGTGFSITLLLVLLIKLFFIVFIISLVGGLLFAAKNYIFTAEDVAAFKSTFTINKPSEDNK